jgi:hypothetical protein
MQKRLLLLALTTSSTTLCALYGDGQGWWTPLTYQQNPEYCLTCQDISEDPLDNEYLPHHDDPFFSKPFYESFVPIGPVGEEDPFYSSDEEGTLFSPLLLARILLSSILLVERTICLPILPPNKVHLIPILLPNKAQDLLPILPLNQAQDLLPIPSPNKAHPLRPVMWQSSPGLFSEGVL